MKDSIIENNRLIAEFMGARFIGNGMNSPTSKDILVPVHGSRRIDTIDLGMGKILEYHKSWNWLMPVVEKIESLVFKNDNNPNVTIGSNCYCVIQDNKSELFEFTGMEETKLFSTYTAIVEFIKWYNTQNTK
jgi:hypothetical protein